jgi:hypothetical protein
MPRPVEAGLVFYAEDWISKEDAEESTNGKNEAAQKPGAASGRANDISRLCLAAAVNHRIYLAASEVAGGGKPYYLGLIHY